MGIRCFLGIALPQAYQENLEAISTLWRERLRSRMSWTRKGNWHITLSFLGEISDEVLDEVQGRLDRLSSPCFDLQAGGAGFFPPNKPPRVAWVGVKTGAKALQSLARDIEQILLPLGFAPSKRPFQAHLTLARIKQAKNDDWQAFLKDLQSRQWPLFRAEACVLWQSRLTSQGPVYSPIKVYPFA